MVGHSKWSKVERIKGPLGVKRDAAFSKLVKEITVTSRTGGGGSPGNPRLRSVVETARAANMPEENVEDTGELAGDRYEEAFYESYAPGSVALVTEAVADDKNRTAADLRLILSKHHGSPAASSVLYMFHQEGRITIPRSLIDEDHLLELTLDAGAEEIATGDTRHFVTTPPERLHAVAEASRDGGIGSDSPKHTYLPETTVAAAAQVFKLHVALEACDDTQNVHSDFDIPEEALARLSA